MTLSKENKDKVIQDSQRHESDTGSPEVQASLLSRKINELSKHLKKNRKDKHSRRGLLGMVNKRRSHLSYLQKKDPKKAEELAKEIKG